MKKRGFANLLTNQNSEQVQQQNKLAGELILLLSAGILIAAFVPTNFSSMYKKQVDLLLFSTSHHSRSLRTVSASTGNCFSDLTTATVIT